MSAFTLIFNLCLSSDFWFTVFSSGLHSFIKTLCWINFCGLFKDFLIFLQFFTSIVAHYQFLFERQTWYNVCKLNFFFGISSFRLGVQRPGFMMNRLIRELWVQSFWIFIGCLRALQHNHLKISLIANCSQYRRNISKKIFAFAYLSQFKSS